MHNQETWIPAKVRDVLTEVFSGEWGNEPSAFSQNAKVLRSTDIDDNGHINYRSGAERNIAISILISKRLKKNDILLEVSGGGPTKPVGRVAFFNNPFDDIYLCSNFFRTLRTSKVVHPKFLFWMLLLFYNQPKIWSLQQQTTGIINLKTTEYLKQTIMLPPLREQLILSDIFDTLDTQIQQTEQLIAKLKQMKAGLSHNLLTRGIDENGESRDPVEHPEQFKKLVVGKIPKEWKILRVKDAGTVQLGRQRSPRHQTGQHTTPYVRVANVFDGFIDFSDILSMDFNPKERNIYNLISGDILLNEGQSLELVGRSAIYQGPPDTYCFQNTLVRFRCNLQTIPNYCRAVFKYWLDTGKFTTVAKQTTSIAHLGADRFARMNLYVPSLDEQCRIAIILNSHDARITTEETALAKLKHLKKGLMHDLLTGRVRVTPLMAESEQLDVQLKSFTDCK